MVETRPKKRTVVVSADQATEVIKASKRHVGMLDIIAHVAEKSEVSKQVLLNACASFQAQWLLWRLDIGCWWIRDRP